jgi:hypothetical protein
MAKNYASLHASSNDSIALEQRFYVKEETTRGELKAPTGADFLYTLAGGSIEYMQAIESSPHRSGRHHNNVIKKKKEGNFSFSTFFNINTTLGAPGVAEIDPACRVLWKSLLGAEDVTSGLEYTAAIPNLTFSIFEVADKWARQMRGAFIQSGNMTFPGDGEAKVDWAGNGKDALYIGLGKSTAVNAANTVTLEVGEGKLFENAVGGLVMIIHADGTTRSTDTPDGTPRTIVSVVGDVVTLSGAVLTDADGSALNDEVYLCYYEPATPVGIDNPVTGLVGSFAVTGFSAICARTISVNVKNDHELVNNCYGKDSLSGSFYVPGSRLTAEVSFESNMNENLLKLFKSVEQFTGQDLTIVLGAPAGRRLEIGLPKVLFSIPSYAIPDTGAVPVTFSGTAYQTAFDAADEISVHFK